jgi:hypothetical protein
MSQNPSSFDSHDHSSHIPQRQPSITYKSHRLRTSPVIGEGSTYVPVVKFTQSFTQRNALRGLKPVYGSTPAIEEPQEGDIVSIPRPGRIGVEESRAHGWTISITSSDHTEDDLQVEVQQHFEPARPRTLPQQHERGLLGGAEPQIPSNIHPRIPSIPQVPRLAQDRVVITKDDLSRLRVKCISVLVLGILFPPLWVLMGWGHVLDAMILPSMGTTNIQQQKTLEIYKPYRMVAGVLAGIMVLGTFVGIIIGGLALGGVIV